MTMKVRPEIPTAENSTNFDVVSNSTTVVGTTLDNLKAAIAGETGASAKYAAFAKAAKEEGFEEISHTFSMISEIEKTHGDRFGRFADLLEQGKLFVSDVEVKWMCLNCGQIIDATMAPAVCPVCKHPQGYFIRWELAPFE